jgi:tetratricopeptide (TPR) repeat protein
MQSAKRITGRRLALGAVLTGLIVAGCSGAGKEPSRTEIDPAIALFVSGHYQEAADRLDELAQTLESDESLREVYYYLGRCYLELGRNDRAIEAFSAGVSYGDTGGCVDYLERLQAYVETGERGVRLSERLTRRQLAAEIARAVPEVMGAGAGSGPGDPDATLRAVVERGWMRALPDGKLHGDAEVTRAALYVTLSRVANDLGVGGDLLAGYRAAFAARGTESVRGTEASALLDEIARARK